MHLLPVVSSDRIAVLDGALEGIVSGRSTRACLAEIYDTAGDLHVVHLKVSSPDKTALAGDVTRWLLGAALGASISPQAYLCQVPAVMLDALWPDIDWRDLWGHELIPGFASESLPVASVSAITPHHDPQLQSALANWPDLLRTAALDEWGANADDNLNNLLQIVTPDGQTDFATIDGSHFLGGDVWTHESIRALWPDRNGHKRHSKLLRAIHGATPPRDVLQGLIHVAQRHMPTLELVEPQLYFWLREMLDDESLAHAVLDCLAIRTTLGWLQDRIDLQDAYSKKSGRTSGGLSVGAA